MEKNVFDSQKDGESTEGSLHSLSKNRELSSYNFLDGSESKSKKLMRRVNSQETLILEVKQLPRSKSYIKDSFLRRIRVLNSWIPKRLVTEDEKYLRCCLEHIHASASKTASGNLSLNWGLGDMSILFDGLDPGQVCSESTCNLVGMKLNCPISAGTESLIISSGGNWIVGSIMANKSMANALKSPLLKHYGTFNGETNLRKVEFHDRQAICYDFMNSLGGLSNYSSNKLHKGAPHPGSQNCGPKASHKRFLSVSSTTSASSDHSCSSPSGTITQGMLQCTWKGGSPHFVFSLDGQNVVYVANMSKAESTGDKALDCVYLFHSNVGGQKEHEIRGSDAHLVGKMKVSTSFTFCPENSKIMEREFVLYGGNGNFMTEIQTSSHDLKKNKGLPKKVADMFRISQSTKKRTMSRFGGSSSILENDSRELFDVMDKPVDVAYQSYLSESHLPPNLELVAIIVKEHLPSVYREKSGGWGLKFLKNVGLKQKTDAKESSGPFTCDQDAGHCSASMEVVVPAGIHGGPMTRNGGPSSLVDRWRSGGCCDCGGWDLGCPLTILESRSSKKELSSQADARKECKLIEFSVRNSEDVVAPLRMVNIYDGYYFVHFQSTLSALQSFSIAVAFIHSQNSTLQPQNLQDSK